jgi:RNA polymerase sigma-70 factor (ECF subfamily)
LSATCEDDPALVARANAGDAAAFTAIYRAHGGWAYGLALGLTGDREDALDVVQEAFAALYGKFPGFVLSTSLRAYLYPVVRHQAISLLRKRRRVVPLDPEALAARGGAVDPAPGPPAELERMIGALPPDQREVARLRFGLGFRLEEIADALAVPTGTVKSRLHNALRALRKEIDTPR